MRPLWISPQDAAEESQRNTERGIGSPDNENRRRRPRSAAVRCVRAGQLEGSPQRFSRADAASHEGSQCLQLLVIFIAGTGQPVNIFVAMRLQMSLHDSICGRDADATPDVTQKV